MNGWMDGWMNGSGELVSGQTDRYIDIRMDGRTYHRMAIYVAKSYVSKNIMRLRILSG